MKTISDWMKTWTIPEAVVGGIALVCLTAISIVLTLHDDWGKLVHFITSGDGATFAIALGAFLGAVYSRARRLPPATALLFALALGSTLVGCGAQLSDSQHAALALETQRCLVNEREIVDRPGTTEEQDRADLAAERTRCDAARAAIVGGE